MILILISLFSYDIQKTKILCRIKNTKLFFAIKLTRKIGYFYTGSASAGTSKAICDQAKEVKFVHRSY